MQITLTLVNGQRDPIKGGGGVMEEGKLFDRFLDLPDGYQVQLMVLAEPLEDPVNEVVYRSRIWLGHESQMDPMLHIGESHWELRRAIDSCFSMLLQHAPRVFDSPVALAAVDQEVHTYFTGCNTKLGGPKLLTEGSGRARITLRSNNSRA